MSDALVHARRLAPILVRVVQESADHLKAAMEELANNPSPAAMSRAIKAVARLEKWLGTLQDELLVLQENGEVIRS